MAEARSEQRNAEALVAELNSLVEQLEHHQDTELREKALDLVQLIMELYGETFRRVTSVLGSESGGDRILGRLVEDEVVRAVLLIHDLMPISLYDRVAAKLSELRPFLVSQGCEVELLGIDDGRARVRVIRSGKGAPPVEMLKTEIDQALGEVAPDLAALEIEGFQGPGEFSLDTTRSEQKSGNALLERRAPLVQIKRKRSEADAGSKTWVPLIRSQSIEEGEFRIVNFEDINVLILKLDGEFYAYQNSCAAGGQPLDNSLFESPMLSCVCHGYGYDLRRGNCIERPELKLKPFPLRVEDYKVKIGL